MVKVRTPATGRTTGSRPSSSLPTDLLEGSCRRVSTAAIAFACVWIFALVMGNVLPRFARMPVMDAWPMPGNLFCALGIGSSLAVVYAVRRLHHRHALLLDLGLLLMVFHCALGALVNWWVPLPYLLGVSWVALTILGYCAITPSSPRKVLVAALVAATMDPLAMLLTQLRGVEIPFESWELVWPFSSNYVAAFLAVIPSRIVRSLSRQVSEARELGSYKLGDVLGKGGMGEVHRAEHRLLARPAAVKLIRPELLDSARDSSLLIERFKREAQAAAALSSPHTIDLYDFGVAQDGSFYIVMELLDGVDADGLVARFGPVPPERTVHLLQQACKSLAEAHAYGMVHRDLKPSNIYVSRRGLEVDFVKVLDFGLVRAARDGDAGDAKLTQPNFVTGTPAFMAPEVALGGTAEVRSDVYSLGCLAYWLVTGRLVFEDPQPTKVMFQHVQETPVPPSRRSEFADTRLLDELVLACLAKKPEDRPADAAELGRLLSALRLPSHWTEERARRWWDTNLPKVEQCGACDQGELMPQKTPAHVA